MVIAHSVICPICKQKFDRDKVPFVQMGRRYAHQGCANLPRMLSDQDVLEEYIKQLFKIEYITPRIKKQINDYVEKYKYSYTGIMRSLKYFYEIKHNSIDKANGSIGIVPWIYQEAYNYYYTIWAAARKNDGRAKVETSSLEVVIPSPMRRPFRKKKFKFLDEEIEE